MEREEYHTTNPVVQSFSFAYDSAGRRTKLSMPNGASANYSYNNGAYTYDRNGNLIKKLERNDDGKLTTWTYTYDYENRLIKAAEQKDNEITKTVSFKYDPFGRRIEKKVEGVESEQESEDEEEKEKENEGEKGIKPQGQKPTPKSLALAAQDKGKDNKENRGKDKGKHPPLPLPRTTSQFAKTETTRYFYDNEDIILEYNQNGKVTARYVHGPGIDEPLAVTTNHGTYYYHADGLGSIVALTDTNGKTQQTYEYDSFGNLKDQKNKIKQPYTYTGREWDKETGLYYYRARYYDPKIGRFVSMDPFRGFLMNPKTQHRYSYVGNSPINFIDPLGLVECKLPDIPLLPDKLKPPKFDIPYTDWWPGTLSPWVDPKGLPKDDWLPPNDASKIKNEPIWGLRWEWRFK